MTPEELKSLDPRKTVLVYAVCAIVLVGSVNFLLMLLGFDDGSASDYVRGGGFIALTTVLLWTLLVRKRRRIDAYRQRAEIQAALAGQSNDALVLEDGQGHIVAVNRRAEIAYGRSADELRRLSVDDLRLPGAKVAAAAARAGSDVGGTFYVQAEHVTADGRRFPVEESSRVVEIGGRRYLHHSMRDLSNVERERDLLRMFYDLPFVGMAVISGDGSTIESVNDEFCRMLGLSRTEFLECRWPALFNDGEPDDVLGLQRRLARGEIDRVLVETALRRRDGVAVDVTLDVRCTRNSADQSPGLFLAMARDVTLRNRTFRELQQAHRHLRSIIDASDSFIWLVDTEGRFLLMNERMARRFGGRPGDFVGRRRPDIVPAADVPEHERNDRTVTETGQPLTVEERLHREEGDRYFLSVKFPLRDSSGQIYAIGGIATDVTELRAAEATVVDSERKYRLLFESNPNPMWLYEVGTLRVLAVNTAAIAKYGYTRDEFLRMTIAELRFPEDVERLHAALRRIGDNYDESGPWRHRRKDGSAIHVQIISHVIMFEGRRARLVLPIDITQRLEAEAAVRDSAQKLLQLNQDLERRVAVRTSELLRAKERAEAADRVKSVFLASMSHELRTPLSSIIGFSDVLLSQADGPLNDAQRRQVTIVQDAGRHLLGLISDVLDISRIEAGALSLRLERVDLACILRDECNLMRNAAEARGLAFDVRGCGESAWVTADARRTRQVAANLLSNAIKFTDRGSVTLSLEVDGASARVTVEDTGIGIERRHLGEIFEPFRRIEVQGSELRDGAGLGLPIVLRLLEAMGGHLGVESEPGLGTRFWFTLPLASRVESPVTAKDPASALVH